MGYSMSQPTKLKLSIKLALALAVLAITGQVASRVIAQPTPSEYQPPDVTVPDQNAPPMVPSSGAQGSAASGAGPFRTPSGYPFNGAPKRPGGAPGQPQGGAGQMPPGMGGPAPPGQGPGAPGYPSAAQGQMPGAQGYPGARSAMPQP